MEAIQAKMLEWGIDVKRLTESPVLMVVVFMTLSRLVKYALKRMMASSQSGPPGGNVREVTTKEEWDEEMRKATEDKRLVIVDFTASWCGPCKVLKPKFADLSLQYQDTVFLKVDVDKCKGLSREQKVEAMPTIKTYKNGVCVQTVQGALFDDIVAMIKKNLPEVQKKLAEEPVEKE